MEQARVHDPEEAGKILDVFRSHGHTELDTARGYGRGTSEEMLGELNWQKRGIVMGNQAVAARAHWPARGRADEPQRGARPHGPRDVAQGAQD